MAPFSKPTFAVILSSSLLLQLFLIFDHGAVSEAVVVRPRRSLDFSSVQPCRCCQSSSKYQYSVVIDAGSSGSRVHVYRWTQNTAGRVESTPGAVQALRPTLKIRVGLETIARNLTIVRQHVERLLNNASRIVPPELHQYTPIYFMATAGMREMMAPSVDEVMTHIESLLLNTDINPFFFDSETGSRVLSGEEEAVFDWISVNYLLGNFAEKADNPLVGVVEMGGASVQIAFVPRSYVTRHLFPVHVTNRRFLVYARSYLGYGQSSVIDYVTTRLEADNHSSNAIYHPCMLRGDVQVSANRKTFIGTGNPQACVDFLKEYVIYKVKDASVCPLRHCAIGPVSQPPLSHHLQFYAIGAFTYTLSSIDALVNNVFVPSIGYQKAFEFCQLSYDEAVMSVDEAERKYVTDKCLAALYIPLLLNHGLGFSNDSSVIHVPRNIAGEKAGWTLGAVLYENSRIQHECESEAAAADNDEDIPIMLSHLLVVDNNKAH